MTFAGDIDHPAFTGGLMRKNYLVYGAVKDYVYVDWDIKHKDTEWNGTVKDCKQPGVKWIDVAGGMNEGWNVEPLFHYLVKVIVKRDDKYFKGVNTFVNSKLKRHFVHHYADGWVAYHHLDRLCEYENV